MIKRISGIKGSDIEKNDLKSRVHSRQKFKKCLRAEISIVQWGFRGYFKCLKSGGFERVFFILKNKKFRTLYIANIKELNWHCLKSLK